MSHLSIELLGPVIVRVAGAEVRGFGYAKVRALLIYLAAEGGRPQQRDRLAELLWPDQPGQAGRSSLRQALARLRQLIGDQDARPPLLLIGRESVGLNPAGDVRTDLAHFDELLAGVAAHAHPAALCAACVDGLERAAALYRGPFAEGALPGGSQEFEDWAMVRREWLARGHREALARLADHYEARGEHQLALGHTRRLLEQDPWREPSHRQAMRLLAALGERGAALAQYERCRRTLADQLGVEPEPATTTLYEGLRGAAGPAAQGEPPVGRRGLPAEATSFVGRAAELGELQAMLAAPECRLITLLGPGGVGKTRLALRLAELSGPGFRDGVCWAALADVDPADDPADALARALGCPPDSAGDRRAALRSALGPRQTLLVLDNLEHLLGAADLRGLVGELLAAAPQLKIIATSRERLQLRAEWAYDLGGLSYVADGAGCGDSDAVRLLLERARQQGAPAAAGEELAAAITIARTVAGSPLALELAAAARRLRPFAAIAAAIGDGLDVLRAPFHDIPERHRSMRATLAYSWRLLADEEQRAMAWLSVFRDGFDAEAAAAVAGAGEGQLAALADKSMLRRAGARYAMHELVRRYAAEELGEAGRADQARAAHMAHWLGLAERAEPELGGAEQEAWLARLEGDHANLQAALEWAIAGGHAEPAQRLGAALTRFWWMRGHQRAGRQWLERSLRIGQGDTAPAALAARARALHGAGGLAMQQGDSRAGRELIERSLALERAVGRKGELSRVLNNLALAQINLGDYAAAEASMEECLALDHELGDRRGVAFDLGTLGQLRYFQGSYEGAAALYAESLALHRELGDQHSVAVTLLNAGATGRLLGRSGAARAQLEESLALFRGLGAAYGIAFCLPHLASLAAQAGDGPRARGLLAEGLPLLAGLGNSGELAMSLALLGQIELEAGAEERGVRLWGAASRLRAEPDGAIQPPDEREYDRWVGAARARIDPGRWAAAWAAGAAMDVAQALAYAQAAGP